MIDRVKVRCDVCGAVLATIVDVGDETFFRWRHGETTDANAVFCPTHGWPDLTTDELLADLARAREIGKVVTYRARVSLAPFVRESYADLAR
jgi:hypothetical protein